MITFRLKINSDIWFLPTYYILAGFINSCHIDSIDNQYGDDMLAFQRITGRAEARWLKPMNALKGATACNLKISWSERKKSCLIIVEYELILSRIS